ncbi:nitrite reductase small subunit NirD [Nocardioides sp. SYSU D00065]|uniref:nitrite reductase small subunit NirD n=1 Tax=Nocardioides sp. SYSU D00065 TaxID=2817378 RepID=UPI001B31A3C3|nr:nitrite reductase small subunit NirD [Nocardioides sp. SYSU D00065]
MRTSVDAEQPTATPVCRVDAIPLEGGVAVLVGGEPVAVFRTYDGEVLALGNIDPFSGASVLARGIVGSRGDVPVVSSPMYKQAFDLRTGRCLDDESVGVPAYAVSVVDGTVLVGPVLVGPVLADAAREGA